MKPTRTQRIIDVSNGITMDNVDVFLPLETKSHSVRGKGPLLYETKGEMLRALRPGLGVNKLHLLDTSKLPELSTSYGESYFKRIRKTLFEEHREVRGNPQPVQPMKSVERVQKERGQKKLFITEYDQVWKDESEEQQQCTRRRRKKEEEVKLYPHHKYNFAAVGKEKRRNESIFSSKR